MWHPFASCPALVSVLVVSFLRGWVTVTSSLHAMMLSAHDISRKYHRRCDDDMDGFSLWVEFHSRVPLYTIVYKGPRA